MIEKPIEWRRFERVELEGEVAKTAPRTAGASPVSTPPSLLHEFERVLRENERLQLEVATLRAEAARNAGRPQKFREELESARVELARIEGGPGAPPAATHASPSDERDTTADRDAAGHVLDPESMHRLATVIAGYIFADPSAPNVRLVEDALCAKGILRA